MKRLSNRHIISVGCCADWPDLISSAEKAPESLFGYEHAINPNKIIRLYELEYKLFKLKSLNSSRPSTLKTIEKLENELSLLLPEMLHIMKNIYGGWINYHKDVVIDDVGFIQRIQRECPEVSFEKLEEEYDDYQTGGFPKHYNIFKKVEMQLQKEQWSHPPLSNILETYKLLQRGPSGNVGQDDALFNRALNICHFGGPFSNYFSKVTGISSLLLTELSEGTKFMKKWDAEISKFAKSKISKRAEVAYGYWLSPEGKLYPVGFEEHGEFIRQHPELFGDRDHGIYDLAFSKGWARVVTAFKNELDFDLPEPDNKHFHLMQNAISRLPQKENIIISFWRSNHPAIEAKLWDVVGAKNLSELELKPHNALLNPPISKRAMPYGWWLSPDGALHAVEREGHGRFIRKHPEIFGNPADKERIDYNPASYALAFNKGWTRITYGPSQLYIQVPSFDSKYLDKLQNATLPITNEVLVADFNSARNYFIAPYWDFMQANSFNALKHAYDRIHSRSFVQLPISKRADKIDYPHKMFEEISAWAKSAMLSEASHRAEKLKIENLDAIKKNPYDKHARIKEKFKMNMSMRSSIFSLVGQWTDEYDAKKFGDLNVLKELMSGDISKIPTRDTGDILEFESRYAMIGMRKNEKGISGRMYLQMPCVINRVPNIDNTEVVRDLPAGDLTIDFNNNNPDGKLEIDTIDENWIVEQYSKINKYVEKLDDESVANMSADPDTIDIGYPKLVKIRLNTPYDADLFTDTFFKYQTLIHDIQDFNLNFAKLYISNATTIELNETVKQPTLGTARWFKVNIEDTEQWQKHSFIRDPANWKKLPDSFKSLEVFLRDGKNSSSDGDFYERSLTSMTINIYNVIEEIADGGDIEANFNRMEKTLKHELVHMMQALITELKKADMVVKQFSKEWFCPKCGFKSKTREYPLCPKCNVYLIHRQLGVPGKFDPKTYQPYSAISPVQQREEWHKLHAISDVEFFTRLQDAAESLTQMLKNEYLEFSERVAIMDKFPAIVDEVATGRGISPQWERKTITPIEVLSDLTPEQKKFLMNHRIQAFLKYNETLIQLQKANQTEKVQKFIRELYRVADKAIKQASLKISKRAGKINVSKELIDKVYERVLRAIIHRKEVFKGEDAISLGLHTTILPTYYGEKIIRFPILLFYGAPEGAHWAAYRQRDNALKFYAFPEFLDEFPDKLDYVKSLLRINIEHELTHMAQFLMSPHKENEDRPYGLPGKFDPEHLRRYIKEDKNNEEEYRKYHTLSDIEFFPLLNDSINRMKAYVFGANPESMLLKKQIIDPAEIEKMKKDLPGGEKKLQDMGENKVQIAKDRLEKFLIHNKVAKYLRLEPIKYHKFLRELHRAFEEELNKYTKEA